MDISFIGFRMGSLRLMRMIGLVGLMRVFGDSLERRIVLVFVFWVRPFPPLFSYFTLLSLCYDCNLDFVLMGEE